MVNWRPNQTLALSTPIQSKEFEKVNIPTAEVGTIIGRQSFITSMNRGSAIETEIGSYQFNQNRIQSGQGKNQ